MHLFLLKVGSFHYDSTKMVFKDEYISNASAIRSVLDYYVEIRELPDNLKFYLYGTGRYFKNIVWYYTIPHVQRHLLCDRV